MMTTFNGIFAMILYVISLIYSKKEGREKSDIYSIIANLFGAVFSLLVYIDGISESTIPSSNINMYACVRAISENVLSNSNIERIDKMMNDVNIVNNSGIVVVGNVDNDISIVIDEPNKMLSPNSGSGELEGQYKVNDIIQNLSLSKSKAAIEELLGKPQYTLPEEGSDFNSDFYILESGDVIIRCIFKDNSLVGYLVTVSKIAEEPDNIIEFPNPISGNAMLQYGDNTIGDIEPEEYEGKISVNYGNGGECNYYWQYYQLLFEGYDFVVAILPYGFHEESAHLLMESADAKINDRKEKLAAMKEQEIDVDKIIFDLKGNVHPNTYGIIDMDYEEVIKPWIRGNAWKPFLKDLQKS